MGLLNVRLDPDLERKVKALRAQGIVISDLLRAAITDTFEKCRPHRPKSLVKAVRDIHAKYPSPHGDPETPVDTTDRHAVQAYIRGRLMRKRA